MAIIIVIILLRQRLIVTTTQPSNLPTYITATAAATTSSTTATAFILLLHPVVVVAVVMLVLVRLWSVVTGHGSRGIIPSVLEATMRATPLALKAYAAAFASCDGDGSGLVEAHLAWAD